jgi:hypothetical protein
VQRGSGSLIALVGSLARVSFRPGDTHSLHRMIRTCTDIFKRIQPAAGADVVVQVAWEEMCKQLGSGSPTFDAEDKVLPQTGSSGEWMERIARYADLHSDVQPVGVSIWQSFIEMTVVVCRSECPLALRLHSREQRGRLQTMLFGNECAHASIPSCRWENCGRWAWSD